MHRRKVLYDSGAKVSSLSEIIYISLDTFQSVVQNINTELEAWLMFFSSDRHGMFCRRLALLKEQSERKQ